MTLLLKHNDLLSFNYFDPYSGLLVASWRVHSVISDALEIGADPVHAIQVAGDRESIVLLRQPADYNAKLIPSGGRQNVVIEGKYFVISINGPTATLERLGMSKAE